ncbi:hypothetical protein QVD17_11175 [Tagetes erecta]|uniref:Uncharacterized protein n=1 Tax=Tagetes erecta TaxID=13708 RepID=A0AAD8L2J7_TARER|nr:hypothetical protein QVD17_11175 [Tagetes erecta]
MVIRSELLRSFIIRRDVVIELKKMVKLVYAQFSFIQHLFVSLLLSSPLSRQPHCTLSSPLLSSTQSPANRLISSPLRRQPPTPSATISKSKSADIKKQTVFFLQTADVWSTSSD